MNTLIVFGMLIASTERRLTATAVPALPVYRFVPGCLATLLRPGSMVKMMLDGATQIIQALGRATGEMAKY